MIWLSQAKAPRSKIYCSKLKLNSKCMVPTKQKYLNSASSNKGHKSEATYLVIICLEYSSINKTAC